MRKVFVLYSLAFLSFVPFLLHTDVARRKLANEHQAKCRKDFFPFVLLFVCFLLCVCMCAVSAHCCCRGKTVCISTVNEWEHGKSVLSLTHNAIFALFRFLDILPFASSVSPPEVETHATENKWISMNLLEFLSFNFICFPFFIVKVLSINQLSDDMANEPSQKLLDSNFSCELNFQKYVLNQQIVTTTAVMDLASRNYLF